MDNSKKPVFVRKSLSKEAGKTTVKEINTNDILLSAKKTKKSVMDPAYKDKPIVFFEVE